MTKPTSIIKGAAAAPALGRGVGVAATEEQARAILSTARRAVEEEEDAGAGTLSVKRSLECFLEGRRNKALRHGEEADASSSASN